MRNRADDISRAAAGSARCRRPAAHGSKFDLAGRVVKNVPAPTNLTVPPYRLAGPCTIVVGEGAKA